MINVCKHCQKQYFSLKKGYTCEDCKEIDKMYFEQIRAYLNVYPNSNAIQLSEALNIKATVILKYVDEGSLTISKGSFEKI